MKKIFLSVFTILALVSCQNDDNNVPNNEPVEIAFEHVKYGEFGGAIFTNLYKANYIINSEEEWDDFYYSYTYGNDVSLNDVDYSQSTVIAAVQDFHTGIGDLDHFEVMGVTQQNDTINVSIHAVHASSTGVELTMSYQPYHVIKIPKTTLPFKFTYTE